MKILVCISKSPDTTSKIAFSDQNTKFDENGVQYIVNPYDEWYALVRALEIKEANGGSVTIITVGTAVDDPVIRKALAIGADSAVRIDASPSEAYYTATQISAYAKDQSFDLVLLGKETINYNGSQVGGMLAQQLDLPFVSVASKLDINDNILTVENHPEIILFLVTAQYVRLRHTIMTKFNINIVNIKQKNIIMHRSV